MCILLLNKLCCLLILTTRQLQIYCPEGIQSAKMSTTDTRKGWGFDAVRIANINDQNQKSVRLHNLWKRAFAYEFYTWDYTQICESHSYNLELAGLKLAMNNLFSWRTHNQILKVESNDLSIVASSWDRSITGGVGSVEAVVALAATHFSPYINRYL